MASIYFATVFSQSQDSWLTVLPYTAINETSNFIGEMKVVGNDLYALTRGLKLIEGVFENYYKIAKLDSNGDIAWEHYYDNVGTLFQVGGSFTVDDLGNSYFVTGDVVDPTSGQKRPQLHMLDPEGNLRWRLEFTGDDYFWLFDTTNGLTPRKDGNGVVYVGQISGTDSWMKLEVDTLGNVLSQLTFEAPVLPGQFIYGYAMKVVDEADGDFLVAYQNSYGISGEHSYLVRFDSTGQVLASHNTQKSTMDILEWGEDKIVWGLFNIVPNESPEPTGPYIYCYDAGTLDSIWGLHQTAPWLDYDEGIAGIVDQGGLREVTETKSGKLVSMVRSFFGIFALQQFDQNGQLEWTRWVYKDREMWYDVPHNITPSWEANFLDATEDGGFVVGGTHIYQDLSSPVWNGCYKATYLMKLDSFGCAVPGCQNDTIYNISIISEVAEITTTAPQLEMTVFPNPTQDRLRVQLSGVAEEAAYLAGLRYSVYDHLGRRLATGLYESDGVKVGDLQPGYYYLRVRDGVGKERMVGFLKQ
ncbi:hypothetical protein CEQ90_19095 [Lewinellaceae bacterium SD302]|nr:hypothetical protein CEQ90_19095 [Lewinellaceae bacterium SD302]